MLWHASDWCVSWSAFKFGNFRLKGIATLNEKYYDNKVPCPVPGILRRHVVLTQPGTSKKAARLIVRFIH